MIQRLIQTVVLIGLAGLLIQTGRTAGLWAAGTFSLLAFAVAVMWVYISRLSAKARLAWETSLYALNQGPPGDEVIGHRCTDGHLYDMPTQECGACRPDVTRDMWVSRSKCNGVGRDG